jgi:hypothetical protein
MVIENARMMVGAKAIETLSTAYLNALDFAKNRVQGADLTRQADKAAPRVTIIHHPDVRRMLMLQKSYAEGLRALVLYTASLQDAVQAAGLSSGADAAAAARNDLLLPVIKGVGSERAYEMLTLSLQTLGGSGFLQDYPIEQYIRDAKIDSLYEGTTAIQSMDFFFRKVGRDSGASFGALMAEIAAFADDSGSVGENSSVGEDKGLKTERAALADAVEHVEGMVAALSGYAFGSLEQPAELYKVGQHSVRFLLAFGDLVIGWLLARQAEIATARLDAAGDAGVSEADRDFYAGKLAAARFFTTTVLPRLESDRKIIEQATNDLMDIPEAAF